MPAVGSVLVAGAAGFIGSQLVDQLLRLGFQVVGVDNLSRGRAENLSSALRNSQFKFVNADLADIDSVRRAFSGTRFDRVWHLAANSDISSGTIDPNVDLRDTFLTTFHLLNVMRETGSTQIAFASTSAVYGVHEGALNEDTGPLFPISNYGAMKLASEAAISAATETFLERAWIFRFPNVVGSRATHGIILDLMMKLKKDRTELEVLGNGSQQKPYLHVSELLESLLFICERSDQRLNWFNIGPLDAGVRVKQIAETVLKAVSPETPIRFTGGDKGWPGDVPRVIYSVEKLKRLGWSPRLSSLQAIERAVDEIKREIFSCN